ncbi:MAG: hypothetical protein U9Q82_02140 [Chloroflexota bacterium]|nr:hypothetical protein [Chloroflexota bacterium]
MSKTTALQHDQYYHIYNRGNNRETLFRQERNYHYFIQLYAKYIYPIADTFAYCLLPNHFHFLVRIKSEKEILKARKVFTRTANGKHSSKTKETTIQQPKMKPFGFPKISSPSQYFGNLFNAYTKAINKVYGRTGSLFEKPFHRKLVTDDNYFCQLILYIHFNPQKHGLIDDFRLWPFSSYAALLSEQPTRLKRDEALAFFDNREIFILQHDNYKPGELDEE